MFQPLYSVFRPHTSWGPALQKHRTGHYAHPTPSTICTLDTTFSTDASHRNKHDTSNDSRPTLHKFTNSWVSIDHSSDMSWPYDRSAMPFENQHNSSKSDSNQL